MEWFSSKTGCSCEPSISYGDGPQTKGCCMPPVNTIPPCSPIMTVATRTKCVALRLVFTFFLLILIMASIYRVSARNVPRFSLRGRPQMPLANLRSDATSNPNSDSSTKPRTIEDTDEQPAAEPPVELEEAD